MRKTVCFILFVAALSGCKEDFEKTDSEIFNQRSVEWYLENEKEREAMILRCKDMERSAEKADCRNSQKAGIKAIFESDL